MASGFQDWFAKTHGFPDGWDKVPPHIRPVMEFIYDTYREKFTEASGGVVPLSGALYGALCVLNRLKAGERIEDWRAEMALEILKT